MNPAIHRALVLLEQSRPESAEREARKGLAHGPNDPIGHAVLAAALAVQEKYKEATVAAEAAVHLGPTVAYCHYIHAVVLHDRNRVKEAEQAVLEALRLSPEDADYFALLASIKFQQRDWRAALHAAEQGLKVEAEHTACVSLRARALLQLGRKEEAGAVLEGALARAPEDASTQVTQGWSWLHRQNPTKAMGHFREALRLQPNLEAARAGIVEALKAKRLLYRLMLRYFLWMSTLSSRARWGVIIGLYLGFRLIVTIRKNNPELSPYLAPIAIMYVLFVYMAWTAQPLFNLLLRFERFGRLALSRNDVVAANCVGGCLLTAIVLAVLGLITVAKPFFIAAFMTMLVVIPVAAVFACPAGWPRRFMSVYTAVLVLAGVAVFMLEPKFGGLPKGESAGPVAGGLAIAFFLSVLFSSWIANMLATVRVKR
ncbi:MAG: tetratricopeptide repeat protein [Planctomycetota bacterium]